MTPASPEFSRREFVKVAASIPIVLTTFLRENGRISAQESQTLKVQESSFEIPQIKTLDDHFRAFTLLAEDNMKPEGLELLGIHQLLADEQELKKHYQTGTFTAAKIQFNETGEINPLFMFNTQLSYNFFSPEDKLLFNASYLYCEAMPNKFMHMIGAVIGSDGKLRKKEDTTLVPQDVLQQFGETYFKLPIGEPYFGSPPTSDLSFDGPGSWNELVGDKEERSEIERELESGVYTTSSGFYENKTQMRTYYVFLKRNGLVVFNDRITLNP